MCVLLRIILQSDQHAAFQIRIKTVLVGHTIHGEFFLTLCVTKSLNGQIIDSLEGHFTKKNVLKRTHSLLDISKNRNCRFS